MASAASLGGSATGPNAEVNVLDAGDTPETAVAAARRAIDGGAQMLIGPLFSAQSRAVAEVAGRKVPVVSLSNDSAIAGGNVFVFGITPAQSARAILSFAATRGIRDVVTVVPPGTFGSLSGAAARDVAGQVNIAMPPPLIAERAAGIVDAVRQQNGGKLPAAVYLPVVSGAFAEQAAALRAAEVQLLGSEQWASITPYRVAALQGAWFAGPDPVRFEAFASALENNLEVEAGIVAGLTFDAVEMARILGRLGKQDRKGLLRDAGFDGVLGAFKFTADGQCRRGLAVLNVADGATTLIGTASA